MSTLEVDIGGGGADFTHNGKRNRLKLTNISSDYS